MTNHGIVHEVDVVAALLQRNGKFLLCRRPEEKRHGGLWEFPGGKVDPGESFRDALRRELEEELRLVVSDSGHPLASIPDESSGLLIHFIPTEAGGNPEPLEHSSVDWVRPSKAQEYSLAPADQAFVEQHFGEGTL